MRALHSLQLAYRRTLTHGDPIDHRAFMFAFVMTTKTFWMAFNAIRYVFCNLQC